MSIWIGDPDCVEMMQAVDALPRKWRALVYEHGALVVLEMYDDGNGPFDAFTAEVMLEQRREKRQREWLATNFITPRARKSFTFKLAA